jgi:hypothetical protein
LEQISSEFSEKFGPPKLSGHRIDGNQRPNQVDYGCDILASETTAMLSNLNGLEFANADELAVFPNPGVGIVRTDPATRLPDPFSDGCQRQPSLFMMSAAVK